MGARATGSLLVLVVLLAGCIQYGGPRPSPPIPVAPPSAQECTAAHAAVQKVAEPRPVFNETPRNLVLAVLALFGDKADVPYDPVERDGLAYMVLKTFKGATVNATWRESTVDGTMVLDKVRYREEKSVWGNSTSELEGRLHEWLVELGLDSPDVQTSSARGEGPYIIAAAKQSWGAWKVEGLGVDADASAQVFGDAPFSTWGGTPRTFEIRPFWRFDPEVRPLNLTVLERAAYAAVACEMATQAVHGVSVGERLVIQNGVAMVVVGARYGECPGYDTLARTRQTLVLDATTGSVVKRFAPTPDATCTTFSGK